MATVTLVVLASVAFGFRAVQTAVTARTIRSAVLSTQTLNLLVVNRNLSPSDIRTSPNQATQDNMDGDLYLLEAKQQVAGLQVWALSDGHLVYGDPDHQETTLRPSSAELKRLRAGTPLTSTAVDDYTGNRVLRVLLPFDTNGDGTPEAASAVLLPRDNIDGSIASYNRWLGVVAGFVLLLIAAAVVGIRRRQMHESRIATHDALTGLGNRTLLARRARRVLGRATGSRPAALLLIDLDGFKAINDTLGHQAGDDLLVAVGGALNSVCRSSDVVIRLGGDEFAVLMPRLADYPEAGAAAWRLLAAIREPVVVGGVAVNVNASIGVAHVPAHGTHLADLLHAADLAMYEAKRVSAGVVVHDAVHRDKPVPGYPTLLPQLGQAISAGQLHLRYQPMWTRSSGVTGVEALLQWNHPEYGVLPASEFVPLVEQTGLIRPLIAWVLSTASAQCAQWRAHGYDLKVTVNMPVRALVDTSLPDQIVQAAAAGGIPPTAIAVEIGHAAMLGKLQDRVAEAVRALAARGVDVIVDDVGQELLSVLSYRDLPISAFKVHPRYAADAARDPVAAEMVGAFVSVGHLLGVKGIAQGVISAESWALASDLGCDGVQGPALVVPLRSEQLLPWLDLYADRLITASRRAAG